MDEIDIIKIHFSHITDENMPAQSVIISWVVLECKVIVNWAIPEQGVLFDANLLFLVDVLQPPSACHNHSVEYEADLKLHNAIAVLAIMQPHLAARRSAASSPCI